MEKDLHSWGYQSSHCRWGPQVIFQTLPQEQGKRKPGCLLFLMCTFFHCLKSRSQRESCNPLLNCVQTWNNPDHRLSPTSWTLSLNIFLQGHCSKPGSELCWGWCILGWLWLNMSMLPSIRHPNFGSSCKIPLLWRFLVGVGWGAWLENVFCGSSLQLDTRDDIRD